MDRMDYERYGFAEWRISIYGNINRLISNLILIITLFLINYHNIILFLSKGRNEHEWKKLALWIKDFKVFSHQVRWLIQIPRLYAVYRKSGVVENFQKMIDNIFLPLFNVTLDPSSNPDLHQMLFQVKN